MAAGFRYTIGLLKLRHRVSQWAERCGAAGGWPANSALRLSEALAKLPGLGSHFHVLAGLMQAAAGRHELAIPHFEAALFGGGPENAMIHHRLGIARLRAQDPAGAEPSFRRALELAPNPHWIHVGLGECLLTLNRLAESEQVLRRGLQLNPDAISIRHMLLNCLTRQGRGAEAIDFFIELATAEPPGSTLASIPFPWYFATAELATENRAEALRTVVERHPQAGDALTFLACLEMLLGHYAASTARLRQAAALRRPGLQYSRMPGELGANPATPSFLMIGQAKAGTTALFTYLSSHSRFEAPLIKEPHFWSYYSAAGEDWYRAHFPPLPLGSERITGEASTTYFPHPEAPRRIAAALPEVKLIVLLRDPVARVYSEYWMIVRYGTEKRSWEEVVAEELESMSSCPLDVEALERIEGKHFYLPRSAALPHLQRWLAYFPKNQLLILQNAELAHDLRGTLRRVCAFLGLPPFVPRHVKRENEGRYPPMAEATEQRLREWFAPHQQALENFLATLHREIP